MAGNDTAALVVALSAQLTQFEKDMARAGNIADSSVRDIENKFRATNIQVGGLDEFAGKVEKLVTAGGLLAIATQIHALNEEMARIGDTAQRVGLTSEQFQKLRFAIIATGGSTEAADGFLDTFSRKIAEAATGTGALYNFLRTNNVALRDANGQLLPAATLLGKYADLVKNTASPQDRLNEAFLVAGRSAGPAVVAALSQGADGLRRFGDEAERAGVVIDDALIQRARRANEEFQILKLRVTTVFEEAALSAVEAIKKTNADMNQIGIGWSDTLKKAWADAISFIENNSPDAARIIGNLKDAISNVEVTGAPLSGRRGGSEINAPLTSGATDKRLLNAPAAQGDNTTRQYNEQAAALKKLLDAQEKRTALTEAETDSIGKTVGASTTYKTAIELENQALEQNIPLTAKAFEQIQAAAQKAGAAAQALDDYKRQWVGINSAAQFAGDQLIEVLDGLRQKTLSLSDAARNLANSLIHALEQAALLGSGPLAGILGTQSNVPGGTGGLIGTLLGGLTGKRAGGGPVSSGGMYLVGENGPELFSPGSSGNIIPNGVTGRAGGGSGANVQVINYTGSDTETKQSTRSTPNGERVVVEIIKKRTAAGEFDSLNRARYGMRPQKVR